MRLAVLVAILGALAPSSEAGQVRQAPPPQAAATEPQTSLAQAAERTAQAYDQFLQAHLLQDEDADAAIAAYKRAIALDPTAAVIVADLADLYMRQSRPADAVLAAEQALKIAPANKDAHRVLGTAYATLASAAPENGRAARSSQRANMDKAVLHLEQAFEPPLAAV